jgi:hypothetical protein
VITAAKKHVSLADIDDQVAIELPARETLALVNVFITNVLNGNTVSIPVQNNHVAVQVCAVINALSTFPSLATPQLTCSLSA